MSVFNISEEEKNKIREQHRAATQKELDKIASNKSGLKAPEKKVEEPKEKKK